MFTDTATNMTIIAINKNTFYVNLANNFFTTQTPPTLIDEASAFIAPHYHTMVLELE